MIGARYCMNASKIAVGAGNTKLAMPNSMTAPCHTISSPTITSHGMAISSRRWVAACMSQPNVRSDTAGRKRVSNTCSTVGGLASWNPSLSTSMPRASRPDST